MLPNAILFDLDGTLVDHFTTIWRCVNYAQERLGYPLSDYDTVRRTVGGSVHVTLSRLTHPDVAAQGVAYFREQFQRIWFEDLRALDGARWILRELQGRGVRTAVFTNKQHHGAENVMRYLGLDASVDAVLGTRDDGARAGMRKPELRFTQWALDELGASAETTGMVGDSPFDFETGLNAGLPTWLVATGSHTREQLEALAPGRVHANLYDLGQRVFGLELRGV